MNLPRAMTRPLVFSLGAAAAVGAVVFVGYMRFTSMDSRYCWTCHDDIWSLWQDSQTHPPEHAGCVDCHEDPVHRARTGVVAVTVENLNENCRDCHEDMVEATTMKRKLIKMSHKVHVTDERCQCTDCHRTVAHDRHPAPSNRPTKWSCYVCHEHEKEIDGEVNEKNCMRCHYILLDKPAEGTGEEDAGDETD